MRGGWFLAAIMTLTACGSRPPTDCRVVEKQAIQCMERFGSDQEREMLLACFPFSKPQKISGAWYHGFEIDLFAEGERAVPGRLAPHTKKANYATLAFDPQLPNDGRLRVLQVELIGRRSKCPMGYPDRIILVDRMVSRSIVSVSK